MVVLHQLFDLDDNGRIEEKAFSNGDVCVGRFQGTLPHGKGKYAWSDGTVYDGDWEEGKMTGKGQMLWPSRAKYEGDFAGGYIHGIGTLNGHDGSEYRGSWRMNIQHGVGKKLYPNLDVYEGSWKEGLQGGSGRYCWNNGNMYIGEWKAGTICGRGVMKWLNGDLYDGFWSNGLRHGSGVYRFTDGSYYFGTWSKGLKDGKGTFYPAGTKLPSFRNLTNSLSSRSLASCPSLRSEEVMDGTSNANHICSEKLSAGEKSKNSGHRASRTCSFNENCSLYDLANESVNLDPSLVQPHPSDESQNEMQENGSTMVYEREYTQGVLIKETIRDAKPGQKAKQKNKFTSVQETKKKSRVDIFEGRRSYYLMLNLQLGIRYTVGKITPVPRREVRSSDFGERARIRMYFPRKGSKFTPPHKSGDFFWKDYCPMVFRNLREMFKLDAAEYMMSICGDDGLREICTPGKSGCLFYVSHDDRFVIKTLKKHELKCLLKILPSYYAHVKTYENTLITKYFGVHRIKLRAGKKVRFIVMGNMFFTELKIHRRYDLKGSTEGRFTEKEKIGENTTLKDCDLEYEFHMDKLLRESLLHQLSVDSKFLESQQIIDYSLLLGLHFRAPERLSAILETQSTVVHQESSSAIEGGSSRELLIPPKGLLLVTHEPSFVSTAPGPHIRGSTLRAFSVGEKEVDLILPGTARLRVQLGVHMPAQANHKLTQQDDVDSSEVELFEVYDVVLYLGLIDILQEYNMVKKVEHAYKSLKYDPQKISVVDPKLYSKRFLSFMQRVFLEQ